jgi:hypothetical protein
MTTLAGTGTYALGRGVSTKISFLRNGYGVGVLILVEVMCDNLVCATLNQA